MPIFCGQVCGQGKCQNSLGSFQCICDDGFSIKERLEDGCTDDDECALDLYHCDPFARCRNTNGSYDCTCREGFTGDGFTCQVSRGAKPTGDQKVASGQTQISWTIFILNNVHFVQLLPKMSVKDTT